MWIWVFQELLELLSSFLSLTYPFNKAKDSHLFYMVTCKRTTVHKQMQVNHHSSWFNAPIIYGSNHEESPSENSWNWVMKIGACCNIKRDTTARAHPFISIHSSYSKQHGSISLILEVVNASITLGKWPEVFAGTDLHVKVGRHFKDLLFQVPSLQINHRPCFHPAYIVNASHSTHVFSLYL